MKILVTGATGFVGKAVINRLLNQGHTVIGTSRRVGKMRFPFDLEVRHYDFEAENNFDVLLKGVDVICHAASWATMWGHKKDEYANYFLPTKTLIDEAKRRGVKRFVLTSTIVVNKRSQSPLPHNAKGHKYGIWPHLDYLIDLENYLSSVSDNSFQSVSLRLGHFIGAGNTLGMLPVLLPRLKTFLVPWIAGGKSKVSLIGPNDIAQSFELATKAKLEENYHSFNITSSNTPTMRELLLFIHDNLNYPKPLFSVPFPVAYAFAYACEMFGNLTLTTPFLTRPLVHLSENWQTDHQDALAILGYQPTDDWQEIVKEHVKFLHKRGLSFKLQNH